MPKPKHDEHEEHEDHFDPLEGIPHGARKQVQRLYHTIDEHVKQVESHHSHIDHHNHAINKIHQSSESRHHLLGLINHAMGRSHAPHTLKPRAQRKIAKHHTKIAKHTEKIETLHHEIDRLHGLIDQHLHKHAKREQVKNHIRQALGLHHHANYVEEITAKLEEEPIMVSPEMEQASAEVADRLGLTATHRAVTVSLKNPNAGPGHKFLRTAEQVVEHLTQHFPKDIHLDTEDQCEGFIDKGTVPAVLEYLDTKDWRVLSKGNNTVAYKHPTQPICIVVDYAGLQAGHFWCY